MSYGRASSLRYSDRSFVRSSIGPGTGINSCSIINESRNDRPRDATWHRLGSLVDPRRITENYKPPTEPFLKRQSLNARTFADRIETALASLRTSSVQQFPVIRLKIHGLARTEREIVGSREPTEPLSFPLISKSNGLSRSYRSAIKRCGA